ncbi:hypothetical protein WMY93_017414 [Mugilogobius chulae]|uniref:Uncharacterized protein n=1 Tax=Mugilogobius chulae TaxID=88201 RepID=A0AAW0NT21_9GOBI
MSSRRLMEDYSTAALSAMTLRKCFEEHAGEDGVYRNEATGEDVMGNSESQYSIQGPKGAIFPGKHKPPSLKARLSKDDTLSPHSWWKSAPVGSGYKARCVGRGCLSPPKSRQPYSTRHYDYVTKRGSPSWQRTSARGIRKRHLSDDYEDNPYGAEVNTSAFNEEEIDGQEDQSSPRVVIKKDGSLRVEFTNTSGNPLVIDGTTGPVQLLKFSPNLEPPSTPISADPNMIHSGPPPASTSSTAGLAKEVLLAQMAPGMTPLGGQQQNCVKLSSLANQIVY